MAVQHEIILFRYLHYNNISWLNSLSYKHYHNIFSFWKPDSYLLILSINSYKEYQHFMDLEWVLINSNMRQQNWFFKCTQVQFGRLLVGYTGILRLYLHWKYGNNTWRPTHLFICKDLNCFAPITDRMQKN